MRSVGLEEYRWWLQDTQEAFVVTKWAVDSDEVSAQILLKLLDALVGGFTINDGECLVWHQWVTLVVIFAIGKESPVR